jgi:hypothetical protein
MGRFVYWTGDPAKPALPFGDSNHASHKPWDNRPTTPPIAPTRHRGGSGAAGAHEPARFPA